MTQSKTISNDELIGVYKRLFNLTDIGYVVNRFFADVNFIYNKAMSEAKKEDIDISELGKISQAEKVYIFSETQMGRWSENTGMDSQSTYYNLSDQMKEIGTKLLPDVVLLVKEVKELDSDIIDKLADKYSRNMGFKGCEGETGYHAMLYGYINNLEPYTPHAIAYFGEQIKGLCHLVANNRGIDLPKIDGLSYNKCMKERRIKESKISFLEENIILDKVLF